MGVVDQNAFQIMVFFFANRMRGLDFTAKTVFREPKNKNVQNPNFAGK